MNLVNTVKKIRACEGSTSAQLLMEQTINNVRLETIEECAKHIETPEKGTSYNWVPHSLYGNIVLTIASKIRSLTDINK